MSDITSDTTGRQDVTSVPDADDSDATSSEGGSATLYIAAQLRASRAEREQLKARLDALQARERTLWADARRAGVSFGRIADVSGMDRATVFYALNPRGSKKGGHDG